MIEPSNRVLEIGTGSGYQTAILCKLAKEVFSVERIKPLLDDAFERLMDLNLRNVHFRHGDGTLGWPEQAPFDRILIAAGAPEIPRKLLLSQLIDGGVAVLPYGPADQQLLVVIKRVGQKLIETEVCACRFVKLFGAEGWRKKKRLSSIVCHLAKRRPVILSVLAKDLALYEMARSFVEYHSG